MDQLLRLTFPKTFEKKAYHWVSVQVIVFREAGKNECLLYTALLWESVIIANRPAIAENLFRQYT